MSIANIPYGNEKSPCEHILAAGHYLAEHRINITPVRGMGSILVECGECAEGVTVYGAEYLIPEPQLESQAAYSKKRGEALDHLLSAACGECREAADVLK